MTNKRFTYSYLSVVSAAMTIAAAASAGPAANIAGAAGQPSGINAIQAVSSFQAAHPQSPIALSNNGSISRVYGKAFSHGTTSQVSADSFVAQNANMWGVAADELIARGPFADGHHVQPIGYLPETDSYKFTGHYYTQTKAGLPVFRSKLVLLVRNEANFPLVLASAQLHDLSNYQPDAQIQRAAVNQDGIVASAAKEFDATLVEIQSTERMIFAGTELRPTNPTVADVSTVLLDGLGKQLIVTDAATGEILYQENLIHTIDITGNASALASDGPASMDCEAEVSQPLPYLRVSVQGGNSSFTDINGNFTIPHGGSGAVTVTSNLTGEWFRVTSANSESVNVTPPGPADLVFNAANNSDSIRAQVNGYVEANRVRDFILAANPSYPQMHISEFPVNVNLSGGFCPGNAWYDGSSINFCSAGSGFPNTSWSSVIHHEFGHHLVAAGGSGQGQYGEGMGDVMSTLILDDPRLGLGFFGSCNGDLRNADNTLQYPQNGEIHEAGQLLSGCVWSTRNEMIITEPATYIDIMGFLAVNAVMVHSGDLITPQITIDYLTLDDDDANIGNGTPHYNEIATGFGAHNMDAPALTLIDIQPAGLPDFISSNGGTSFSAQFTDVSGTLDPSSPTLMVDSGSGFVAIPMNNDGGGFYSADFPSADCGSQVNFYITADATNGATQTAPADAPSSTFTTVSALSAPIVAFDDNGEANVGWSTTGTATDGQWNRGVPVGNGDRADPASDYDGSGACYLTDNVDGNSDVDGGFTTLTSPVMDATGSSVISYARWFNNAGNSAVDDIFVVEISDNNGISWTNLETLGVNHPESNGGWFTKQFDLASIPGFTTNNQFRIRFTAEDTGSGSIVEAGVDAIQLKVVDCSACAGDFNGDGALDFFDVSAFLNAFNSGDLAADYTNDGTLDFFDVSAFLNAFSAGCP